MITHLKSAITLLVVLASHAINERAVAQGIPIEPLAESARFIDPDNDCQIRSKVSFTVPGTNHDLNPRGGMNAPRLLKAVNGDFTAQVKVTGDFTPGSVSTGRGRPFNGAGLLVWQNEDNFLRLERNAYWVSNKLMCYPPLIEHWHDGKYAGFNSNPMAADEFFTGRSTWLKIQRQGERITASFSHDGMEWTVAKEFSVQFEDAVSVGMVAINTSDAEFRVEFESFQIDSH
ncbi:MAG: DUF1349 domain-containing protein [Planctomycetaceae bacterium]